MTELERKQLQLMHEISHAVMASDLHPADALVAVATASAILVHGCNCASPTTLFDAYFIRALQETLEHINSKSMQ